MAGYYFENLHALSYVFLGKKLSKQEDLKEMGDISSGMSSSIMQLYLKQVLEAFFHTQSSVRHFALSVIALTLNQGLIHPVQVRSISPTAVAVEYSMIRNVAQMFRNCHFCFDCNILMIPFVCARSVYPTSLQWARTQRPAWGTKLTSSWWRLTRNTQDSSMWVDVSCQYHTFYLVRKITLTVQNHFSASELITKLLFFQIFIHFEWALWYSIIQWECF